MAFPSSAPVLEYTLKDRQHSSKFWSVAFSPDGQLVAAGNQGHSVPVWDMATGHPAYNDVADASIGASAPIHAVAFSPNGTLLAAASDQEALLWSTATWQDARNTSDPKKFKRDWHGHYQAVAFAPDSKLLALGGHDLTLITLGGVDTLTPWELLKGRQPRRLLKSQRGLTESIQVVAFSPDGRLLASGSRSFQSNWGGTAEQGGGVVCLWDPVSGEKLHSLTVGDSWIETVVFSPDGQMLATISGSRLRLWQVGSWQPLPSPEYRAAPGLAFSPDGKWCAAAEHGSAGSEFSLWDTTTWQKTLTLTEHRGPVNALAFSPDGRRLASASEDETVRVWRLD